MSRGRKPKNHKEPNHLLRREREIRGWSQSRLAEIPSTSPQVVSRWESGKGSVDFVYQEKLCEIFQKNAEQLGFIEPSPPPNIVFNENDNNEMEEPDMNASRRHFLKGSFGLALVTASAEYTPWERLSLALKKPTSVDATLLTELQAITQSQWQLRANYSSHPLLRSVTSHLDSVTELLHHSHPEPIHKQLCSLAGEIAQLAGQIAFEMNEHSTADAYYTVSLEAAREAKNASLYASALGRKSFVSIHNGQPEEALQLLHKAQQLMNLSEAGRTYAWLSAIEAETYAHMQGSPQHTLACQRALEHSETAIHQAIPHDDPCWTGFDYSRLAGYKGACFNRLHQPKDAISALNEALATIAPSATRRRSRLFTDLAIAYALQGEVEEGCQFAHQALELARQTNSAMALQRIHTFRAHVEQWKNTQAVQDLDQKLLFF